MQIYLIIVKLNMFLMLQSSKTTKESDNSQSPSIYRGRSALTLAVQILLTLTDCSSVLVYLRVLKHIQWNFGGSNTFGTMKICSRQG